MWQKVCMCISGLAFRAALKHLVFLRDFEKPPTWLVFDYDLAILFAFCPHAVARLVHGFPPSGFELMVMVLEIVMATAMAMPCR